MANRLFMANLDTILPLFFLAENPENMGKDIVQFTADNYNKEFGSALIDAKND